MAIAAVQDGFKSVVNFGKHFCFDVVEWYHTDSANMPQGLRQSLLLRVMGIALLAFGFYLFFPAIHAFLTNQPGAISRLLWGAVCLLAGHDMFVKGRDMGHNVQGRGHFFGDLVTKAKDAVWKVFKKDEDPTNVNTLVWKYLAPHVRPLLRLVFGAVEKAAHEANEQMDKAAAAKKAKGAAAPGASAETASASASTSASSAVIASTTTATVSSTTAAATAGTDSVLSTDSLTAVPAH